MNENDRKVALEGAKQLVLYGSEALLEDIPFGHFIHTIIEDIRERSQKVDNNDKVVPKILDELELLYQNIKNWEGVSERIKDLREYAGILELKKSMSEIHFRCRKWIQKSKLKKFWSAEKYRVLFADLMAKIHSTMHIVTNFGVAESVGNTNDIKLMQEKILAELKEAMPTLSSEEHLQEIQNLLEQVKEEIDKNNVPSQLNEIFTNLSQEFNSTAVNQRNHLAEKLQALENIINILLAKSVEDIKDVIQETAVASMKNNETAVERLEKQLQNNLNDQTESINDDIQATFCNLGRQLVADVKSEHTDLLESKIEALGYLIEAYTNAEQNRANNVQSSITDLAAKVDAAHEITRADAKQTQDTVVNIHEKVNLIAANQSQQPHYPDQPVALS